MSTFCHSSLPGDSDEANSINPPLCSSFFQSVCVLGYCLTPVVLALLMCKVILILASVQTKFWFCLRLITTVAGFSWATYAAFVFLGESQPKNRKPLAVYPIFLFYFVISWLVISHSTA